MDKMLFEKFPPISAKQWKQKIQYLLQGKDYQHLIHTNSDGISTLPFYTNEDLKKIIPTENTPTTPKPAFYSIVTNEKKANKEALDVLQQGVKTIYFALFNPKLDLGILLKDINCQIIFQCYFLDSNFNTQVILKEKNCLILNDCLGKLSKTGNWYTNAKADFSTLQNNLQFNQNTLSINLTNFQNAGATSVQQLSYAMTQLLAYSKAISLNANLQVVYTISVNTDFHLEIAKIKSLRILHHIIAESIRLNPVCTIIQHKSKRNLSGLFSEINTATEYSERHIGIMAGIDYYTSTPSNFYFYTEDIPTAKSITKELLLASKNTDSLLIEGSIYIKKLSQQLLEKSILLIETIQKGGGYVEQLKKGTIQQKIISNEHTETEVFLSKTTNFHLENLSFLHKAATSYPFLKRKKRKTLWQPIIEKQLRESIERPIWENYFKL